MPRGAIGQAAVGIGRAGQDLDADVVGARVEVGPDPVRRGLLAGGDERVDQAVAAAVGQVFVGEAEPAQVRPVVRGLPDVRVHVLPGDRRCRVEHHRLLDGEVLARPEPFPGRRRVLRRDEVRVRAVGPLGRQVQRARAERREQPARPGGRRRQRGQVGSSMPAR